MTSTERSPEEDVIRNYSVLSGNFAMSHLFSTLSTTVTPFSISCIKADLLVFTSSLVLVERNQGASPNG